MQPAPLSKKLYKVARAHGWMKLKGNGRYSKAYNRIGDTTSIVQRNEFETEDIFGNDAPTRTKRDSWLVQKGGNIQMGVRNWTALNHSLMFLTDPDGFYTQALIAADTEFLTDELATGEAVLLPFIDGVITAVLSLDAVPIEYIEGTHYTFDNPSGIFEIVKHPAGVVLDVDGRAAVTIEHGAPAITAADKRDYGGILERDTGEETELMFLQVGAKGPNLRLRYHSATFLNTEDIPIANDENTPVVGTLTGTLAEDPSKPQRFRWGDVLALKDGNEVAA